MSTTPGTLVNPTTGVTATPTESTTVAQQTAAQGQGFQPMVTGAPSPISVDTLGTGTKPVTIPSPINTPLLPSGTVSVPPNTTPNEDGTVTANPPAKIDTTAADTRSWVQKLIGTDINALGGEGAARTAAETTAGLETKTTQANADYNAYQQAKIEQTNTIEAMRKESGGLLGGTNERIAAYRATSDANISNLAIQANISQGNLTAAQNSVDRKITNQFQPIKDQIDSLTKFATLNNNDLTESEKFQLTQKADQMKTDTANVQKASEEIHKALLDNGNYSKVAPDLDKIMFDYKSGKIDATTAQNQMYAAVGSYGVSAATAKIKAETALLNDPSVTTPIVTDPNSTSILAQTGLSMPAFAYMTQGTTALTRMTAPQRLQYMKEAENYLNRTGTDISTFQAQYKALSGTVTANVMRNNQATVAENELKGTIDNIRTAATEAGLGNLSSLNIAKIWAGKQLNTPEQSTFKFHLEQIRKEFAMYNAALSGQLTEGGQIRDISEADYKRADEYIQNGFAKGSIDGFETALNASMDKMSKVLGQSIDAQNQQVWKLFGIGDKYKSSNTTSGGIMTSADGKSQVKISDLTPAQITEAKNAGWK